MMQRFWQILALLCALGAPALAQNDPNDFDAAMAGVEKVMGEGDEAIYIYLSETIQKARATGRINPDFTIFFAMLTDQLRNYKRNPGLALLVAEEGIALISGVEGQDDFRAILHVSMSYALADLGRLKEAYDLSRLNMVSLSRTMGEEFATGYAADADLWGEGQLSSANTSATDLAREVLERAYPRFEAGEYAGVLSLTSAAILPMGSGLPEQDVRGINTEIEWLSARALDELGRSADSANAFLRALGYMMVTPWQPGEPADWWGVKPLPEGSARVAFQLFLGLADTAATLHRNDIQRAAIEAAVPLAAHTDSGLTDLLMRRAVLAVHDDDGNASVTLLEDAAMQARKTGDIANAHAAEFYITLVRARVARDTDQPIDPAPIIASLDPLLAVYRENLLSGAGFFLLSAAQILVSTDAFAPTLDYAREALREKQATLGARGDSAFGNAAARRDARGTIEVFLDAAHNASAAGLDPAARVPACDDVHRYVGCLVIYE